MAFWQVLEFSLLGSQVPSRGLANHLWNLCVSPDLVCDHDLVCEPSFPVLIVGITYHSHGINNCSL